MLLEIDLLTLSMGVGLKLPPFINPLCGQMGRPCPDVSIYRYGVEITPDINPIYVGLEMSCPWDSKNVSNVGVGLV